MKKRKKKKQMYGLKLYSQTQDQETTKLKNY